MNNFILHKTILNSYATVTQSLMPNVTKIMQDSQGSNVRRNTPKRDSINIVFFVTRSLKNDFTSGVVLDTK